MKKYFAVAAVLVVLICTLVVTGCTQGKPLHRSQIVADEVINKIHYIKDPRTNICFAYEQRSETSANTALVIVPCDAIPPALLATATL